MEFVTSSSLKQPWRAWYKPGKGMDVNPLAEPKSLTGKGQGTLPQKPRQVDLAAEAPAQN